MNKKDIIIDDIEDLEIKRIAYLKPSSNYLLYVLIFLFCVLLGSSFFVIRSYYINKNDIAISKETIEINTEKSKVLIVNNGALEKNINKDVFSGKDKFVIEQDSYIEVNAIEDELVTFDVIYNIFENDFEMNEFSTLYSDVLVKFSYSFDNEEWKKVNNVISTSESTITPMMGSYYDISGIRSKLKVSTNYEMDVKANDAVKMYWRSEVVFKNPERILENKKFKSELKIEYKDND